MLRTAIGAAILVAFVPLVSPPASAVALRVGGSGGITPQADLGACATVTFPPGELFVGQFTAVAEMQGPGTKVGTVRGALPIVAVGSWTGCIPGAYTGATAGEGKYALDAHSTSGDLIDVQQCVVNRGVLTCV